MIDNTKSKKEIEETYKNGNQRQMGTFWDYYRHKRCNCAPRDLLRLIDYNIFHQEPTVLAIKNVIDL